MNQYPSAFYVTGGTLRRDAPSYVPRQADQDLHEGLRQGKFCYVLTSRQMGKSSLMVRTAARLREEGATVAILDLTRIGQNLTPEQWYDGLLGQLGEQLNLTEELETFWLSHDRLGPLDRWMRAVREIVLPRRAGQIVIFVDEIDAVRSLPFSTDEFFAAIRECYNRRTEAPDLARLTFCLLGVATPSDLIRDTRTTPFNIGQRIKLNDFTETETAPLAEGLGRDERTAQKLLRRIFYWTGGHPYLTQRLCQAVAEDAAVTTAGGVDRLCEELFFTTRARERDDNLLFVRERLLRSEADTAGLLDLYSQMRRHKRVRDDETNPLVSFLRLSGIARVVDGLLYVRNRIYYRVFDQEWVTANLPDAELQRQRTAYRRGLLRATAIAAVIILAFGALALIAFQQRNRAEEQGNLAAQERYTARMMLVNQALESQNFTKGDKLLKDCLPQPGQPDIRGFEWYYLWRNFHEESATLSGHTGPVGSVVYSPDGRTLASGSDDKTIKLWNAATGQLITTLSGHTKPVSSLAFAPDGKTLASRGDDIRLWNLAASQQVARLGGNTDDVIGSIAFSPDGKVLASEGKDKTIKLWNPLTGQLVITLSGHTDPITSIAFSPDGKVLASAGGDIRLWNVATGQLVSKLTDAKPARYSLGQTSSGNFLFEKKLLAFGSGLWGIAPPLSIALLGFWPPNYRPVKDTSIEMAFSPNGKTLATISRGTIKLWDVATGQPISTISGPDKSIAFSPDGKTLASADHGGNIGLWNSINGQQVATLRGHTGAIFAVTFSPDGKTLASCSQDKTVKLWNATTLQTITLGEQIDKTESLAFSPDGRTFASVDRDGNIGLWNLTSGQLVATLKEQTDSLHPVAFSPDSTTFALDSQDMHIKLWNAVIHKRTDKVYHLAFSPDGKMFASGGGDNSIRLWNVVTRQLVATLTGHTATVLSIAFSPDGNVLASGSKDNTIRLWNLTTGQHLATLSELTDATYSIAFSPDGKMFASAGRDMTVRLWNLVTRRQVATLKEEADIILSLVFSPDGRMLASGSENIIKLWNVATGQPISTLNGHTGLVLSMIFSPDGKTLASGSGDRTIKLWNVMTEQFITLSGHNSPVRSIAFAPDGKTLASGGDDNTIRLWRGATDEEVQRVIRKK